MSKKCDVFVRSKERLRRQEQRDKQMFQFTLGVKGTVMQIEKPLINDYLPVSKVSWMFYVPTVYTFAVIYPSNLLFS